MFLLVFLWFFFFLLFSLFFTAWCEYTIRTYLYLIYMYRCICNIRCWCEFVRWKYQVSQNVTISYWLCFFSLLQQQINRFWFCLFYCNFVFIYHRNWFILSWKCFSATFSRWHNSKEWKLFNHFCSGTDRFFMHKYARVSCKDKCLVRNIFEEVAKSLN